MKPAPNVARKTPSTSVREGRDYVNATEMMAVKTTNNEVRNPETEGLISLKQIICVTNPTSIMLRRINPPRHCSASFKAARAFGKKSSIARAATAKRAATKTATTFYESINTKPLKKGTKNQRFGGVLLGFCGEPHWDIERKFTTC